MPRICVAFAALSVCILASGCVVSSTTHKRVVTELENSRTDVGALKTKVEEADKRADQLEESKKLVEEQLLGRNKDLAATIEELTDTVGQAKKEVQDINKDLLQAQTLLTAAKRKEVADKKEITAAKDKAKQADALAADLIVENAKLKKDLAESESRIKKLLIEEEPASATEDATEDAATE